MIAWAFALFVVALAFISGTSLGADTDISLPSLAPTFAPFGYLPFNYDPTTPQYNYVHLISSNNVGGPSLLGFILTVDLRLQGDCSTTKEQFASLVKVKALGSKGSPTN